MVQIGDDSWFSRTHFNSIRTQVIQALSDEAGTISLDELLKLFILPGMRPDDLDQLQEVISACLQGNNQVFQVTQTHWLHRKKITGFLDNAYDYLLEVSQASTDEIVQAVLCDASRPNPDNTFCVTFENYLGRDPRFSLISNNQKVWRAIPKEQRDNDIIFKLLSEFKHPLSEDEIIDKLQLLDPAYSLADDSRFQSFPSDRWGLSFWVCLNDLVYEYLLRSKDHLHENVVVGLVCKEKGIRSKYVFFLPDEDPRFAKDDLNRWFCRYKLKPNDLDRLLAELDRYAGAGLKLDVLFRETLRLYPDATNAGEVLPPILASSTWVTSGTPGGRLSAYSPPLT